MSNSHIDIMTRVNSLLSSIPNNSNDDEYNKIKCAVSDYLLKKCNHKIVRDYVDVDPDRSWVVFYCIHCETTFDSETPQIEK
jgi:hypothetical protein